LTNSVPSSIGDMGITVDSRNQLHIRTVYDAQFIINQLYCYERRLLQVAYVKQQAVRVVRPY